MDHNHTTGEGEPVTELSSARKGKRKGGQRKRDKRRQRVVRFLLDRLVCYQPEESRATLSAQHASTEHHVVVHTLFVEPFNPILGAQYLVLGEVENAEGVGVMVRARVLNCVDGVNIALLQRAINVQRSFFRERECKQGDTSEDANAT